MARRTRRRTLKGTRRSKKQFGGDDVCGSCKRSWNKEHYWGGTFDGISQCRQCGVRAQMTRNGWKCIGKPRDWSGMDPSVNTYPYEDVHITYHGYGR